MEGEGMREQWPEKSVKFSIVLQSQTGSIYGTRNKDELAVISSSRFPMLFHSKTPMSPKMAARVGLVDERDWNLNEELHWHTDEPDLTR